MCLQTLPVTIYFLLCLFSLVSRLPLSPRSLLLPLSPSSSLVIPSLMFPLFSFASPVANCFPCLSGFHCLPRVPTRCLPLSTMSPTISSVFSVQTYLPLPPYFSLVSYPRQLWKKFYSALAYLSYLRNL